MIKIIGKRNCFFTLFLPFPITCNSEEINSDGDPNSIQKINAHFQQMGPANATFGMEALPKLSKNVSQVENSLFSPLCTQLAMQMLLPVLKVKQLLKFKRH